MEKGGALTMFKSDKLLLKVSILSLSLLVSIFAHGETAYAGDMRIIGNTDGVTIELQGDAFLETENILPGEEITSVVTVINRDSYSYRLRLTAENKQPSSNPEEDLLSIMDLTVLKNGNEIVNGFPLDRGEIDLGSFPPNSTTTYTMTLQLEGKEATDLLQGKSVLIDWIFNAVSSNPGDDEEEPPTRRETTETTVEEVIVTEVTPQGETPVRFLDNVTENVTRTPGDETLELTDTDNPLGTATTPDNAGEDEISIDEEKTPLGQLLDKILPKTGEASMLVYAVPGLLIIVLGFSLIIRRKKSNRD